MKPRNHLSRMAHQLDHMDKMLIRLHIREKLAFLPDGLATLLRAALQCYAGMQMQAMVGGRTTTQSEHQHFAEIEIFSTV